MVKKQVVLLLSVVLLVVGCGNGNSELVSKDVSEQTVSNKNMSNNSLIIDKINTIKKGDSRDKIIELIGEPFSSQILGDNNSSDIIVDQYKFDEGLGYVFMYIDDYTSVTLLEKRESINPKIYKEATANKSLS